MRRSAVFAYPLLPQLFLFVFFTPSGYFCVSCFVTRFLFPAKCCLVLLISVFCLSFIPSAVLSSSLHLPVIFFLVTSPIASCVSWFFLSFPVLCFYYRSFLSPLCRPPSPLLLSFASPCGKVLLKTYPPQTSAPPSIPPLCQYILFTPAILSFFFCLSLFLSDPPHVPAIMS